MNRPPALWEAGAANLKGFLPVWPFGAGPESLESTLVDGTGSYVYANLWFLRLCQSFPTRRTRVAQFSQESQYEQAIPVGAAWKGPARVVRNRRAPGLEHFHHRYMNKALT
jgi:hypothetical protein